MARHFDDALTAPYVADEAPPRQQGYRIMTDDALLHTIRSELFSAVIGDVLDHAGFTHQFLPPAIRLLQPDAPVLAGRALPVLEADCSDEGLVVNGWAEAFGLMFRALDGLRADEVYIATGGSPTYALWGGLMSTRARALGAAGAVLNGFHRDTREILALGFPVFSMGAYAQDQRLRGRVIDLRLPGRVPERRARGSGGHRGRGYRWCRGNSEGACRQHGTECAREGARRAYRSRDDRARRAHRGDIRKDRNHVAHGYRTSL